MKHKILPTPEEEATLLKLFEYLDVMENVNFTPGKWFGIIANRKFVVTNKTKVIKYEFFRYFSDIFYIETPEWKASFMKNDDDVWWVKQLKVKSYKVFVSDMVLVKFSLR